MIAQHISEAFHVDLFIYLSRHPGDGGVGLITHCHFSKRLVLAVVASSLLHIETHTYILLLLGY